jgi:hypothetical protein
MKKLLFALGCLTVVAGCTNLNDGKSMTREVTAQPSPAFMKKVAGDPFPAAGTPVRTAAAASKSGGQANQFGGGTVSQQSGTIQYGAAIPTGTAKKNVAAGS